MLLKFQNKILELIARGSSLSITAETLCLEAQMMAPGALCSVLLVDEEGHLRPLSGPDLPQFYTEGITGLKVGPNVGSCGTAAYLGCDVTVTDIQSDPLWYDYRSLALRAGLLACWSSPISDGNGRVLGTFAFYYREKRGPAPIEKAIVSACVNLCSIAIERDQRVKERHRLAFTDELTSLGNRAAFIQKIDEFACSCPRWGLLLVDIDNLKTINDSFGHDAGDELIRVVARCIAEACPAGFAYRLGGDEFAVLLPDVDARLIKGSADRILKLLRDPWESSLVPKASIGGAEFGRGVFDAATVRRNADLALYHGKATGRGRFVAYAKDLASDVASRMRINHQFADALRHGRFEVLYNPLVDLKTGVIVGLEACCHTQAVDGASMPVESAETMSDVRYGTDVAITMLGRVLDDVQNLGIKGFEFEHIGIEISLETLRRENVRGRLLEAALALRPRRTHFLLQIREAEQFPGIDDDLTRQLQWLRSEGVRVALDGFGSQDASLTSLISLRPQVLKIDSLFINQLAEEGAASCVLEAIVAVATRMDIVVVAEGLQSHEQMAHLLKMGCHIGQGTLFGGPLTASDLLATVGRKLSVPLLVGSSAPTIIPPGAGDDDRRSARTLEAG